MATQIPRIPINLRQHKLAIAIPWIVIVSTACFIPIAVYYGVRFGTSQELKTALSPGLATFGASSLYSLAFRTWSLSKRSSDSRPVGVTSRWALDYFQWNFMILFVGLTVLISVAIALEQVRVASMSLSIIMVWVSFQLLLAPLFKAMDIPTPFRFSSTARGERIRSGCLVIAEDVVAVDGKQGTRLRALLNERYDASPPIKEVCGKLDLLWGISGVAVGAGIIAVIFAVDNESVGFGIGYGVPWIWAGLLAIITTKMVQAALRKEGKAFNQLDAV